MSAVQLITFRFGMSDTSKENFLARTDNPQVIAEARAQLALPEEHRGKHVTGLIQRIPRGQNLGWGWQHIDSEWNFAEINVEVCDARPSYVEDHLDEWLRTPGRFCPWRCRIKSEESAQP